MTLLGNREDHPVEMVRPGQFPDDECNSAAQIARAKDKYRNADWDNRQPILVVVGHATSDDNRERPREARWDDVPWVYPDNRAARQVLHESSFDCWYWHASSGALLRYIDTLHKEGPYKPLVRRLVGETD